MQPRNPGDRAREEFRESLRKDGFLLDDTSDSEGDSDAVNLSPEDVLFDGCRDSDFTHEWDLDFKRRLKSYRVRECLPVCLPVKRVTESYGFLNEIIHWYCGFCITLSYFDGLSIIDLTFVSG